MTAHVRCVFVRGLIGQIRVIFRHGQSVNVCAQGDAEGVPCWLSSSTDVNLEACLRHLLDQGLRDLELFVEVVVDALLCLKLLVGDLRVLVHLLPEFDKFLQVKERLLLSLHQ